MAMVQWIHISDLQFGFGKEENNDNNAHAQMLIERIIREKPDFIIHSGDAVHGAHEGQELERIKEYWSDYRRAVKPLEEICPVLSVPGNHDMTRAGKSMELYCQQTGRSGEPPYFGVTIQGVHVICLDVVPFLHKGGFITGSKQEKWLRQHLSGPRRARCLVAVGHYPIFMSPAIYHNVDTSLHYDESSGQEGVLLPILLKARVDLYLCGHLHIYERTRYGRLTQVMAGANGIAFPDLLQQEPNKYNQILDERQCFVRYMLSDDSIRGEAVTLDGESMDTWSQELNR